MVECRGAEILRGPSIRSRTIVLQLRRGYFVLQGETQGFFLNLRTGEAGEIGELGIG